jgi:DNA-directed RNA polymerase specialized sigma24 family protein
MGRKEDKDVDGEIKKKFQRFHKTKKGLNKPVWGDDVKEIYKEESSPYNAWRSARGRYFEEMLEVPKANPDVLDESCGVWAAPVLSLEDEERLESIKNCFPSLTKLQQKVLVLIGYERKSFENAAAILGMKKGSIQKILMGISKKIKALREKV